MKTVKRTLSTILIVTLIIAPLAGCGAEKSGTSGSAGDAVEKSETSDSAGDAVEKSETSGSAGDAAEKPGTSGSAKDAAEEVKEVTRTLDAAVQAAGSSKGKQETVYVVADAAGRPEETIVSTWLKNPDGSEELTDTTSLTDIENVKGDETYTKNGDGTITWDADGNDIYYQGVSDKELPVTTTVTYSLDGKPVDPDTLAGANGHLSIAFSYDNATKNGISPGPSSVIG